MTGYAFHPEAFDDVEAIRTYIAEDSPDAADGIVTELFDAIELLVQFPNIGFRRPALTSAPVRFKLVRDYLIAYAPDRKPLWIIAIFHGRRDPRVIAAILRGRE